MDDRAIITVDVRIRTRAEMNTATPRFGNWTYHHVQPVRIYFLVASTMLRVITDEDCYAQTRALGINTLCKMCNNDPNRATVRTFIDRNKDTPTADSERHPIARLCASPPFGGFPGINPAQRNDDPHDGPETHKPVSTPVAWWQCLTRIGTQALDAFGLHLMPAPNTSLSASRMAYEWNEIVVSLIGDLEAASVAGAPPFAGKDWKVVAPAAGAWTLLTQLAQRNAWAAHRQVWANAYPQMALRERRELHSFLEPESLSADLMARRGTVPLRPRTADPDFLDYYV